MGGNVTSRFTHEFPSSLVERRRNKTARFPIPLLPHSKIRKNKSHMRRGAVIYHKDGRAIHINEIV